MSNNRKQEKDSFAIIGLGKVGTAVGYLLKSAGYRIVALFDPLPENLLQGVTFTGGQACPSAFLAASQADCILITTNDDNIAPACEEIIGNGIDMAGKKVIHMSGAGGLDLLQAVGRAGASLASIHPLQSFATVEGAIKSIPGSAFGVTAQEAIRDWSFALVRDLGGRPFPIAEEDKPLYHAAACLASNYLVTLMHAVGRTCLALGMEEQEALQAFWPLVQGTLTNIETRGTVQALTGPVARGDVETIARHIAAFKAKLPDLLHLYCTLGLETVAVARAKGTLTEEKASIIKTSLKKGIAND